MEVLRPVRLARVVTTCLAALGTLVVGAAALAQDLPAALSERMQILAADGAAGTRPLIVFFDGGPDETDSTEGRAIADAFLREGVDVALVDAASGGAESVLAPQDVAAVLSALAASPQANGYDAGRIFALGRGVGGAALTKMLLDPSPLAGEGQDLSLLAGAFSLNADLSALLPPPGDPPSVQVPAPQLAVDPAGLPRLLLLTRDRGPPAFAISARRLAKGLRAVGAPFANDIVLPRSAAVVSWGRSDVAYHVILDAVGAKALPQRLVDQLEAEYRAKAPAFSNDRIWESGVAVERRAIDEAFLKSFGWLYADRLELLRAFPLDVYYSVDLLDYIDTLPEDVAGQGDHLELTNVRGQRMDLTREQLERIRPLLVIGIDDEPNLFRIAAGYQTRMDFSWMDPGPGPRPWLIRPLGAFLYVPDPAAAEEVFPVLNTTTRFSLITGGLRWHEASPFTPLSDLAAPAREMLLSSGCTECHAFRGVGGLGYHISAFSGMPEAGLALPLMDYPRTVMERFLFDQKAVAQRIGVNAVPLDAALSQALYDLMREEAGIGAEQ